MEPLVPDNYSTGPAQKCEVIMFLAATKHTSEARIVVSPLYFYVAPMMCHPHRHAARPTQRFKPQAMLPALIRLDLDAL
jgi:hypothetical protein